MSSLNRDLDVTTSKNRAAIIRAVRSKAHLVRQNASEHGVSYDETYEGDGGRNPEASMNKRDGFHGALHSMMRTRLFRAETEDSFGSEIWAPEVDLKQADTGGLRELGANSCRV